MMVLVTTIEFRDAASFKALANGAFEVCGSSSALEIGQRIKPPSESGITRKEYLKLKARERRARERAAREKKP